MRKRDRDRFDRLTTAIIALTGELRREHGPDTVDSALEGIAEGGNVIPISRGKCCRGKCSCRKPAS